MQPTMEEKLKLFQDKTRFFKLAATLEMKLDLAYEIYTVGSELVNLLPDNSADRQCVTYLRNVAVEFMKILLNVSSDEKMVELAERRKEMRVFDPFFLPRGAEVAGVDTAKTRAQYNWKRLAKLAVLLKNQKVMCISEQLKQRDRDKGIAYLTAEQRAIHRVVLKGGKFFRSLYDHNLSDKNQFVLCDTSNMISHGKKGYASYAINVQGEISIFDHYGVKGHYVHSSMYAGAAVFAAGEIKIVKGELAMITAYSGHYQPSIDNIYAVLKYFQKQGVNVGIVQVRLFEPCPNIQFPSVFDSHGAEPKYYFWGSNIVQWGDDILERKKLAKLLDIRGKVQNIKIMEFMGGGLEDALYLLERLEREIDGLVVDLRTYFDKIVENGIEFADVIKSTHSVWVGDKLYDVIRSDKENVTASMIVDLKGLKEKIRTSLVWFQQAARGQIKAKDLQELLSGGTIRKLVDSTKALQAHFKNMSEVVGGKYKRKVMSPKQKELNNKLDVMVKNLSQLQEKIEKSRTKEKTAEIKEEPPRVKSTV